MNKGSGLFKATGIIAIIFSSSNFILMFFSLNLISILTGLIIGVPVLIGGIRCLKFSNMNSIEIIDRKGEVVTWTVVFFLFGGIILGILSLMAEMKVDKEDTSALERMENNFAERGKSATEIKGKIVDEDIDKNDKMNNIISKLERINNLKKQNLISDEEYEKLKKEIIEKE